MAGIAFRNPSAYEEFYDDNGISQIPNAALRPEKIESLEASVERRIGKGWNAIAAVHHYWLSDLIEAVPVGENLVQYRNGARYKGLGAEFELNGNVWKGLEAAASIAVEDTQKLHAYEDWPPNSPHLNGKLRLGVPLDRGRFTIAGAFQYLSIRRTFGDTSVNPVYLAHLTFTSVRLHPDFDVQFGVRNLFDQKAWDPASPGQGVDRLARDGRSVFIKLVFHTRK